MLQQNSLCFPCLEKVRTKFPVFPVPWPPCLRHHSGLVRSGRKRMRKENVFLKLAGTIHMYNSICWPFNFRIRCRPLWNIPYWRFETSLHFCFTLNWKNSMIIKSLHCYKLHITSLFTRILLDLLCVSRRSSFKRNARVFRLHPLQIYHKTRFCETKFHHQMDEHYLDNWSSSLGLHHKADGPRCS